MSLSRDGRLVHEYADAAGAAPSYWTSRREGVVPERFSASAAGLAADWRALVQEVLERYADAIEARLAGGVSR